MKAVVDNYAINWRWNYILSPKCLMNDMNKMLPLFLYPGSKLHFALSRIIVSLFQYEYTIPLSPKINVISLYVSVLHLMRKLQNNLY